VRYLPLILLCACGHLFGTSTRSGATGQWIVTTGLLSLTDEQIATAYMVVDAANRVMPDERGWIAAGGEIRAIVGSETGLAPYCTTFGGHASGCNSYGEKIIYILICKPMTSTCPIPGDMTKNALAHELAHIGLARPPPWYGGMSYDPSEAEAEAGAALIVQEYRKFEANQVTR
jgi:hypothetical protein